MNLWLVDKNNFLKKILFIFRQRGREGERKGQKNQYVVAPHIPPTGDLAHNQACAQLGIEPITLHFKRITCNPGTTIKDTWTKSRGRVEVGEGGGFSWGGVEGWGEKAYNCN